MTPSEISAYREQLEALMQQLGRKRSEHKMEALRMGGGEAGGGISNVPLHPADLGSHEYEEQLAMDLVQNEEQFMEEVNDALERIDRGVFGTCERCKKPISKGRLQSVPYARHCIKCAREVQKPT